MNNSIKQKVMSSAYQSALSAKNIEDSLIADSKMADYRPVCGS